MLVVVQDLSQRLMMEMETADYPAGGEGSEEKQLRWLLPSQVMVLIEDTYISKCVSYLNQ